MNELALKYGCNPNQKPSRIFMQDGKDLPVEVLNGKPGYINFLDAFNSWQLVKELKAATGLPAAASFKHVSPAGAAVATELSDTLKKIYFVDDLELSPIASAYAMARGADCRHTVTGWLFPILAMFRLQSSSRERFLTVLLLLTILPRLLKSSSQKRKATIMS